MQPSSVTTSFAIASFYSTRLVPLVMTFVRGEMRASKSGYVSCSTVSSRGNDDAEVLISRLEEEVLWGVGIIFCHKVRANRQTAQPFGRTRGNETECNLR